MPLHPEVSDEYIGLEKNNAVVEEHEETGDGDYDAGYWGDDDDEEEWWRMNDK